VRRSSVLILVLLATAGVAIATFPFGRPGPSAGCASPIVSAWRSEPASSGWFGYAPLTATPLSEYPPGLHSFQGTAGPEPCNEAARRRLAIGALLAGPGVLVWFLRRRRLDPPTNPNPNLAT
jgi:hypothetical protein